METERVKISQLQVNEQNPRTCTDKQFEKLVRSVITFPKMLEVRPIVVGEGGVPWAATCAYVPCKPSQP